MKSEIKFSGDELTVLHIIGGLPKGGGAEEVLYRLILENNNNRHIVMSLTDVGFYGPELEKHGIEVVAIGLSKSPAALLKMFAVFSEIRKSSPDVVQTWMYYSDFLGGFFARLAGVKNVVWGLHNSTLDREESSFSSRVFARLCALTSNLIPKKIISCSKVGVGVHVELGYTPDKICVIPNGYDLDVFNTAVSTCIALEDGMHGDESLRGKYNIAQGAVVMGMIARFDPQKDHKNLFAALRKLLDQGHDNWVCFLFGRHFDDDTSLPDLIGEYRLEQKVIPYGLSVTIAAHLRQLDLHVLSSRFGEAFPNVLNEAMASMVPCVTTDVGDSGFIVGDCGWTVSVSDPEALAEAMSTAMVELREKPEQWDNRRVRCRQRVKENFTVQIMSKAYETVWREPERKSGR